MGYIYIIYRYIGNYDYFSVSSLLLVVFRDAKMKEITVHKLEEMEKKLGETDKSRGQSDRDIKTVRGGS